MAMDSIDRVDGDTISTVFRAWVIVSLVAGTASIIFGGPMVTVVGVVLIIVGLMSLMPALRDFVVESESSAAE
ncbi:MAG: hypothetical protein ABEJ08_00345 [Halobacteriaceae archaeon]